MSRIFGDEDISAFAEQMPALGTAIAGFAEEAGNVDTETMNKAIGALEAMIDLSNSDLATSGLDIVYFGDQINEFAAALQDFEAAMNEVNTVSIKNKINTIKKTAEDIASIDLSSFTNFSESLKKVANESVSKFTTSVNDAVNASKVKTAATTMLDKFIKSLKSKDTDVKTAAEGIASKAATAVKNQDAYDGFYAAGGYMVDGFVAGIDENTYKAEAEASAMAEAAETAARERLKVNSPSKVFEEIGGGVPEGMANGIVKLGGLVKSAVDGMSNTAINKVKDSISRISDTINTDIDSEPTITPILDLSNVKTGVHAIDSLFGQNQSIGVLGNVGAINSMMSGYNQNGGNDDVVRAINRLGSDISDKAGNTYNINGMSYSNDAELEDALKVIMRYMTVEGRV